MNQERQNYEKLFLGLLFLAFISGLFTVTLFLLSSDTPSSDIAATPTPDTSLHLETNSNFGFPKDVGNLITPSPQGKIDLDVQLTPTPTPNPLFGEGKDININGIY